MTRVYMTALVLAGALVPFASAHAGGDAEAGKAKAMICAACHGPDGNSVNPIWPKLAGQHEAYLAKQIRAFKSGERVDPTMAPMMQLVKEEDIDGHRGLLREPEAEVTPVARTRRVGAASGRRSDAEHPCPVVAEPLPCKIPSFSRMARVRAPGGAHPSSFRAVSHSTTASTSASSMSAKKWSAPGTTRWAERGFPAARIAARRPGAFPGTEG